jgi:hypothetical protein
MKKWKSVPTGDIGNVGDAVRLGPRAYLKAGNGRWGLVIDRRLIAQIKRLYVVQGMNLREVAELLVLPGHPNISHSLVQRICNQEGWIRSHYGRREAALAYLKRNKKKIAILFTKHALTVRELGFVTNVRIPFLSEFISDDLGLNRDTTGMRPIKDRAINSKELHIVPRNTWNRILRTDPNDLTVAEYKAAIRRLTDVVYRRFFNEAHKERNYDVHVDHIFSLSDGYYTRKGGKRIKRDEVVPFKYMVHPENMHIVTRQVNLLKGERSNHTLAQLIKKVEASSIQLKPINRRKELRVMANKINLEPYEED